MLRGLPPPGKEIDVEKVTNVFVAEKRKEKEKQNKKHEQSKKQILEA